MISAHFPGRRNSILKALIFFLCCGTHTLWAQIPPCGPNNTIPAGARTCRDNNGRVWVAPPPQYDRRVIVPPPPPATRSAPAAPTQQGSSSASSPADSTHPENTGGNTDGRNVWLTIGGITAITALIAAIVSLIRAFRS